MSTVELVDRATQDPLSWLLLFSPNTAEQPFAPFHPDLVNLPSPGERQARVVFRSAAKTTLVHATGVHAIHTNRARGVLIVRATGVYCRQSRDAIATLGEAAGLDVQVRHVDHLVIINDRPIWTVAPGIATRGLQYVNTEGEVIRPDLIIVDDLEDDDTARSQMQTERLERYLLRTVIPTASTGHPAAVIMLGTPLSPICLISKAMRREPPFDTWLPPMVVPYVDADGQPAWSGTFDPDLEARTDDDTYATEYLLHPLPPGTLLFPPDRTRWQPRDAMPAMLVRVGVDPATGDGSDRTGIVATGLAPGGIHVVDAVCWRGNGDDVPYEVAAMIRRLTEAGHTVDHVTVEAVGAFKFAAKAIAAEVAPVQVTHGKPKVSKLERAQDLNVWHKNGGVTLAEELRGSDLDLEVHSWNRHGQTVTGHDDMPDALLWSARATTDGWKAVPPKAT